MYSSLTRAAFGSSSISSTTTGRRLMQTSSASLGMMNGAAPNASGDRRPYLLPTGTTTPDWTRDAVMGNGGEGSSSSATGLQAVKTMAESLPRKIRVLVLYGSLREKSYSRLMSYEAARLLDHMGCDVQVYSPRGLPLKDDCHESHPKVQELRSLMEWSEANFWCSPEQHGNITGIFKTMIDHIPLSIGSVRPTQGRILAVSQVNGGSQSFNAVNSLRILGRWMRMFTIANQASLPKAWTAFDAEGRMLPSSNRDRLVDVCEELVKTCVLYDGKQELFADRWSERKEREEHGRLRTQDEKETLKKVAKATTATTSAS